MNLREQLLASAHPQNAAHPPPQSYPPPPSTSTTGPEHPYQPSGASNDPPHPPPQHNPNLDPNVTSDGQQMHYAMNNENAGEDPNDPANKNKTRELSTSKRAAQNRAAQRAFRQRKEGYIKKLEEQVKELQTLEHNFRAMQTENYQLREYILNLQSRLLESSSEFPPAPSHAEIHPTPAITNRTPTPPPPPGWRKPASPRDHAPLPPQPQQQQQQPPPPAPVLVAASADPPRHEEPRHLPASTPNPNIDSRLDDPHRQHQQHDSPYGLGGDYAPGPPITKRARLDDDLERRADDSKIGV